MAAVQAYVYDISQGMARAMSAAIVGKQVDIIPHTGIVCWGREYFYGGGVCVAAAGQAIPMQPCQILVCVPMWVPGIKLLLSGRNTPAPWGGGCRDGWVGWPQISAFWATSPPPPQGVRVRFFWDLGLCRALRPV